MADIDVTADPIVVAASVVGGTPMFAAYRNPDLDTIFYCNYTDVHGNKNAGIPVISASILGSWLNQTVFADPVIIALSQEGTYLGGVLVPSSPIAITFSFKSADILTEAFKKNWVKWSNIGSLDFAIGRGNIAGERPLDWRGWIYAVKKLRDKIVAYGENGVSILSPSGNSYGLNTIYRIGLKGKNAIAGDDTVHFFIDSKGQLWSFGESLEKLDYSEYLSLMSDPVMSYDVENNLVYICDGICGYVYSLKDKSLGNGPVNITGISSQGGTLYVGAPAIITNKIFEICTDVYDIGTREFKTISSIEVGTDLSNFLQASVDFRTSNKSNFTSVGWQLVNPSGVAYVPCFGVEFKFKLRALSYEYFELDYLIVNGIIHNYSYTKHGGRKSEEGS